MTQIKSKTKNTKWEQERLNELAELFGRVLGDDKKDRSLALRRVRQLQKENAKSSK